jgi:signal transduction histidine kinase
MFTEETSIYVTVLVGVATLSIFLLYFVYTMLRQFQLKRKLENKLMRTEIETLESERTRIARDMHDEFAPVLASIKLQLSSMRAKETREAQILEHANDQLNKLLSTVRTIANELAPPALRYQTLRTAIIELAASLSGHITVLTEISPELSIEDKIIEAHLYKMIQELMHNVIRHAEAKTILILIQQKPRSVYIRFEDDGKGFDVSTIIANQKGRGLSNIQHRAAVINGELQINSCPGKGTIYSINIPTTWSNQKLKLS